MVYKTQETYIEETKEDIDYLFKIAKEECEEYMYAPSDAFDCMCKRFKNIDWLSEQLKRK